MELKLWEYAVIVENEMSQMTCLILFSLVKINVEKRSIIVVDAFFKTLSRVYEISLNFNMTGIFVCSNEDRVYFRYLKIHNIVSLLFFRQLFHSCKLNFILHILI